MRHLVFQKFINEGFGWFCAECMNTVGQTSDENIPSRIFLEGEADKSAGVRRRGRAVWKSREDRTLSCPDCGISEVGENEED